MVSSQSVAARERFPRGRIGSAKTMVKGSGERLCRSGRMVLQRFLIPISICTFQVVLFLRTAMSPLRRYLRYCTVLYTHCRRPLERCC